MQFSVNSYSYQGDQNEPKEHLDHREEGSLIEDLLASSFVYKFKHLMSSNMSVCVTDTPLELLQVHFSLDLAHHCHMWFGHDQVGSTIEAKSLVDGHSLQAMGNLGEEGWIGISINGPHIFIEIN